ncbi:MAG: hypothetical protein ACRC42_00275 [Mycoplasma sp.]
MKIKKIITVLSTTLLGASIIGVPLSIVLAVQNSEKHNSFTVEKPEYSPKEFHDNYEEIKKETINTEKQVFSPPMYSENPNNPYDERYRDIFESIDEKIIENDIKLFLIDLVDKANDNLKMKLNKINIVKNDSLFTIDIEFEIFNNSQYANLFKSSQFDKSKFLKPYEVIENKISIKDQPLIPSFVKTPEGETFADYYFNDITWTLNKNENKIKNFKPLNYSKTLNWEIDSLIDASLLGYYDIYEDGNKALSSITSEELYSEILERNRSVISLTQKIVQPVQTILQELQKNDSTLNFFANISDAAQELVKALMDDTGTEIIGIDKIIYDLFQNKPIQQLIIDNSEALVTLLDSIDLGIDIGIILTNPSEEILDLFLFGISSLFFESIEDRNEFVNESKSMGGLTFISKYAVNIMPIISMLSPELEEVTTLMLGLIELTNALDLNTPVLNTIVNLLKTENENTENFMKNILNYLMPDIFSSMGSMLDIFIFDNANLTVQNLATTLDAIANPSWSKGGAGIANYKEWVDSIIITEEVVKNEYNSITHIPDIEIKFKYTFKKNLWINISKLKSIIPNTSIDMPDGSSLPLGLIVPILPSWIGVLNGDYVANIVKMQDKIEYDVIQKEGKNVLSWMTNVKNIIDVNMPQTVKAIFDNAFVGTGALMVDLMKHIFFHEFVMDDIYRPTSSSLNSIEITNYSSSKKNGVAIENVLTEEDKVLLSEEINSSMSLKSDNSQLYSWKYLWTTYKIYKSSTMNSFSITDNIDRLISVNGRKDDELRIYIILTSNYIITDATIIGIKIPELVTNNVVIWTPGNVQSGTSMSNNWAFSF